MKKIFITGATGNIGQQVIKHLSPTNEILVGVRNDTEQNNLLKPNSRINQVKFDFQNISTFKPSLQGIYTLFLLRPPQLADINIFKPLIDIARECNVKEVMFLSVQGAEKSKVIPHNKIERLILDSGLDYIFIRPSYFMQNLTTTLLKDLKEKHKIILPAGNAKFNWVDIVNIGEVCALLLDKFSDYKNSAYEVTGYENVNFQQVVSLINNQLDTSIIYKNTNPLSYFIQKKRDGEPTAKILVMIMLHFLPRFSNEPRISTFYEKLTGKRPTGLEEFVVREKNLLKA
ncbi:MAG TPA: NmrA family NAD(P)-binding protein [Lentimicrobium sp.]|nr:NmrA family NAD(P)-binding protein [Lentimicrobium sp.]